MVGTRTKRYAPIDEIDEEELVKVVDEFVHQNSTTQAAGDESQNFDSNVSTNRSKSTIKTHFKPTKVVALKVRTDITSSATESNVSPSRNSPISATPSPAQNPNGIIKKRSPRTRNVPAGQKLILELQGVRYYNITPKKLGKMGIRPKRLPPGFFPYSKKNFKLGHNPWAHTFLPRPTEQEVRNVHELLSSYHKEFEFGTFVSQPAHGVQGVVTVDAVIQTIFAQSTGNEMAIDAHSRMCNTFTYLVDGKKYAGTIPNWHAVRTASREALEKILRPGGYHIGRAKNIQKLLNMIHEINAQRKAAGLQQYDHDMNPPDAKDFVPGMLSLEYLTDYPKDSNENSDEKLFGRLLDLPLIGIKSAMCIMAFQLKRPLFVVDTHVLRYMKWLGWIPTKANEDQAAGYLHSIIPDDLKYDLHNQIWTHCANENVRVSRDREVICACCGSLPPAKSRDISKNKCPLKDFLPPLSKRWARAYVEVLSDELEEPEAPVKTETDEMDVDIATPSQPTETIESMFATATTKITETTKKTVISTMSPSRRRVAICRG